MLIAYPIPSLCNAGKSTHWPDGEKKEYVQLCNYITIAIDINQSQITLEGTWTCNCRFHTESKLGEKYLQA